MHLTENQYRAIYEHDKNLIVVAGAGSGKTRVLVERYLALLDAHPDWPLNALVAITFTRKAAQEMRDRVRQALEARYREATDDDARQRWSERLGSMDSARIDTIHGLCVTILRANAAEAGIDPDFAVLDETEAQILLEDTLDAALQALIETENPLLELFRLYDAAALRSALEALISEEIAPLPADLFAFWVEDWQRHTREQINRLRRDAAFLQGVSWQPGGGWPPQDTEDKLMLLWRDCHAQLETLLNGDHEADLQPCLEALSWLNVLKVGNVGSGQYWGGKDGAQEARNVLMSIRTLAQAAVKEIGEPPGELEAQAARLLPLWHGLLGRMQAAYRRAKREQGVLDFDDLETLTCDLLTTHESVRARYQNAEFRHVLVDEFQDTNRVQWEIVRALANPVQAGSLFVVGDQKQSIYGFRGADVSVFGEVRRVLTGAHGDAEVALARSFRSHHPLVDCLNAIFGQVLRRDVDSMAYEYEVDLGEPMDAHRADPPANLPALELLLVARPYVSEKNPQPPDAEAVQSISSEDARRLEAYEIAHRLREMVDAGTLIFDRETDQTRPLDYGDVALLFQSMSNIMLYEEVFKAAGLPFVTIAGRGYYGRPEVWDLLNLLSALYNPADDLALASALRSPLFGLSDDALLALRITRDAAGERLPLWVALGQPERLPPDEIALVAFARDCLNHLRSLAGRVTISELLRAALERTGYLATLAGLPDGRRQRGNIEKLLDMAESSGKVTLGAFSQYLMDLSAREVREGEALLEAHGAVSLITAHNSKGLEFPVVVLMDCSWERNRRGDKLLLRGGDGLLACKVYNPETEKFDTTYSYRKAERLQSLREAAERKRLLYVAATRAQDYLLVSGQIEQTANGYKIKGWLEVLCEALSLQSRLDGEDDSLLDYPWGQMRLRIARDMPPPERFLPHEQDDILWDSAPVQAGQPLPGAAVMPPLLAAVQTDRRAIARHLSVTQIADLGSARFHGFYRQRFRQSLLNDAPARLEPVFRTHKHERLIGEIVHEALRWWEFPEDNPNLQNLLRSYAWELGIVDGMHQAQATIEAYLMLVDFQQTDVYRMVNSAQQVYRELPFIFETDQRIIHGVIDLLLLTAEGRWAVIDFKTSDVGQRPSLAALQRHARRYHLQVGAYASAAQRQLRETLKVDSVDIGVYIHYIRYRQTVQIASQTWQAALANLEGFIGNVMD